MNGSSVKMSECKRSVESRIECRKKYVKEGLDYR